jgi:hypothetical protein
MESFQQANCHKWQSLPSERSLAWGYAGETGLLEQPSLDVRWRRSKHREGPRWTPQGRVLNQQDFIPNLAVDQLINNASG